MLSHGIYSVILLIFSNVFMTFAWYGHLKMRQEFSWFAALPLIGVIAFSWAIAFFEYCLQVPANRLGFKDSGGPFDIMQLKVIQEVITLAVFTSVSYTHLTLPTKRIVEISVGGGSIKKKKKSDHGHG